MSLKDLKYGRFSIDEAVTLKSLESHKCDLEWIKGKIISIEDIFESKDKIVLDKRKLELFLNGVNLKFDIKDDIYKIYNEDEEFIGTGEVNQGKLKRDVVI